jgi:hypothetical protein
VTHAPIHPETASHDDTGHLEIGGYDDVRL